MSTPQPDITSKPSAPRPPAWDRDLLKHWPDDLDPIVLADPRLALKLTIYSRINQQLAKMHDPNVPVYRPGPSHWPAILSPSRFILVSGGERSGKSRWAMQEFVVRVTEKVMTGTKKANYWLCGFKYANTHVEFLTALVLFQALGALPDNLPKTNPYVSMPTDRSWSMRLTNEWEGVVITTLPVENPTNIASWPLDGVVLCEGALCVEEVWRKLRARVGERQGWVLMAGTFEQAFGAWYKALYHEWQAPGREGQSLRFPTWENYALFPGGWNDPEIVRIRNGVDEGWFKERYAGLPIKPESLVFPTFDPKLHVQPHLEFQAKAGTYSWRQEAGDLEEALHFDLDSEGGKWPVELAVDPGNADYAVLAIQRGSDDHGRPFVYVVDEVFGRNQDTADLIRLCQQRPWWSAVNKGYAGTIDVAGRARTGSIPVEKVWREAGGMFLRRRKVMVQDGIDKLRAFLRDFGAQAAMDSAGKPLYDNERDWARLFVSPRCRRLIEEFQLMRFPDRQDPTEWLDPERGYDHGIKALWYFLTDRYPSVSGKAHAKDQRGRLIFA